MAFVPSVFFLMSGAVSASRLPLRSDRGRVPANPFFVFSVFSPCSLSCRQGGVRALF